MSKSIDLGILVGRFQVLHKGHGAVIRKAMNYCNEVGIFVGSAQEAGTAKNPFSYEQRKEYLQLVFPDAKVFPLVDIGVGNSYKWGAYVIDNVIERFGRKPEVLFSGREERRLYWVDDSMDIAEMYIPKVIDISATKMKEFIIADDKDSWNEYIEPALVPRYEEMRKIILASKDNLFTESV